MALTKAYSPAGLAWPQRLGHCCRRGFRVQVRLCPDRPIPGAVRRMRGGLRSCRISSTLQSDSGNRMHTITARRMISGLVRQHRTAERLDLRRGQRGALVASSQFPLTALSKAKARVCSGVLPQLGRPIAVRPAGASYHPASHMGLPAAEAAIDQKIDPGHIA